MLSRTSRLIARRSQGLLSTSTRNYGAKKRSRRMEVILLKDHDKLGYEGQMVRVKHGYGRNFLVPQGHALYATPKNKELYGITDESEEVVEVVQEETNVSTESFEHMQYLDFIKTEVAKTQLTFNKNPHEDSKHANQKQIMHPITVKHVLRKLQQQYPFLNITEEQLVDYQNVSEFGEHKVALDLGKGILGIKEQPFVYSAPTNVLNKGDSYECLVNITVNVTEPPQEKKSLLDDEDEEDDM